VISRVSFFWLKSLGPWLSVWVIRYKADCDYRLSPTAKGVRWLVVAIGYVLAASLPGPGFVRVIPDQRVCAFSAGLILHITSQTSSLIGQKHKAV
jgi:hypothetical protein